MTLASSQAEQSLGDLFLYGHGCVLCYRKYYRFYLLTI